MEYLNRELSWLSFNERVLQEASDERNPVVERIRFLGIYSNNLDEFFRIRVANIRRLIAVKEKSAIGYDGSYKNLYAQIREVVLKQQKEFDLAYQKLLGELSKSKIFHVKEDQLSASQIVELKNYFNLELKHSIVPILLNDATPFPRLKDSGIYLAIKMHNELNKKVKFALIKIPSQISRFYLMNDKQGQKFILLDDIIRLNLDAIFSIFTYEKIEAFTFKFGRDAELTIDDDLSITLKEKIEKSIKLRKRGTPVRFVYDEEMSPDLLSYLLEHLNLEFGVNTIAGGRYHNFKDFMNFPDFGKSEFLFHKLPPLNHPVLEGQKSLIKCIQKQDVLLHFPYQRFDYIVDLLREAAIDPKVTEIKINVYRVAQNSQILNALINAVNNGKKVTVFLELMARFDEVNNLYWSNRLKENSAIVLHGSAKFKVHSKLIQITRMSGDKKQLITHVGTGNFHERNAKVYGDLSLLTANEEIGSEVAKVFEMLETNDRNKRFKTLLVSPINTRQRITELIQNEIKIAKAGGKGKIWIKVNNLTDQDLIDQLYKASKAGVKIDMIVRGICCLVPGIAKQSENIKVYSIVDRFLEHARIMKFSNGNKPLYFLSSADWMERNLDERIEVGCPILDTNLQKEIDTIFEYQLKGNAKTRIIDKNLKNAYRKNDAPLFHTQIELYEYYRKKLEEAV